MVIIGKERLTEAPHEMFITDKHHCATIITLILKESDVDYKLIGGSKFVHDAASKQDREYWAERFSKAIGKPIDSFLMLKLIVNINPEYLIDLMANAMNDPDVKTYVESLSSERPASEWD